MKGAWVLLLQAALALIIGLLIAQEVYHQVVVSGEVSDEGALLDQFQGGLGLAVEEEALAAKGEAAVAAMARVAEPLVGEFNAQSVANTTAWAFATLGQRDEKQASKCKIQCAGQACKGCGYLAPELHQRRDEERE